MQTGFGPVGAHMGDFEYKVAEIAKDGENMYLCHGQVSISHRGPPNHANNFLETSVFIVRGIEFQIGI